MWIVAMFDLPVSTVDARRLYSNFRKCLLEEGFLMLQYSVYGRFCVTEEKVEAIERRVIDILPPDGDVRILRFTDAQFGRMKIFYGKNRVLPPPAAQQIEFF